MQEEFSLRQAKLHVNVPRPMPRPMLKTVTKLLATCVGRGNELERVDQAEQREQQHKQQLKQKPKQQHK
ncbi:hypothetical protein PR001_g24758 [Phytophthora rubi]|uniref:Uncharacterized protein n=1 Tax=Phytophthora rubi TaxID=129364 RepID=A0A6A3I9D8_9STRA|nr:hypothetical protein PR001_g24758 [Phytophthora rubi]